MILRLDVDSHKTLTPIVIEANLVQMQLYLVAGVMQPPLLSVDGGRLVGWPLVALSDFLHFFFWSCDTNPDYRQPQWIPVYIYMASHTRFRIGVEPLGTFIVLRKLFPVHVQSQINYCELD